uniref:Uncharacterized protein n=1 Tax=Timema tahoe TaxID=61484 RepID=A0A7R9IL53_9NEOP|nr:unnamed protein product [Timema tahoe]
MHSQGHTHTVPHTVRVMLSLYHARLVPHTVSIMTRNTHFFDHVVSESISNDATSLHNLDVASRSLDSLTHFVSLMDKSGEDNDATSLHNLDVASRSLDSLTHFVSLMDKSGEDVSKERFKAGLPILDVQWTDSQKSVNIQPILKVMDRLLSSRSPPFITISLEDKLIKYINEDPDDSEQDPTKKNDNDDVHKATDTSTCHEDPRDDRAFLIALMEFPDQPVVDVAFKAFKNFAEDLVGLAILNEDLDVKMRSRMQTNLFLPAKTKGLKRLVGKLFVTASTLDYYVTNKTTNILDAILDNDKKMAA